MIQVYADSDSSCFYVVDRYAKEIEETYECVRYRYRFPHTDDVLWEDIDKVCTSSQFNHEQVTDDCGDRRTEVIS